MENIYYNLQNLLKSGEGYLDAEGRLNRTLILNKAYDGDGDLLDLLLGNPQMHKQFFTQTAKALIFKRDDFIEFIAHKNFLADSYTDYKNKIGLGDGKKYLKASNDTVLMFPFKDCVLEGGMSNEEEGKREIFYNEILAADEIDRLKAPKLLTNIKRITAAGESQATGFTRNENGRISDNLLIKGNNFCALHSLKAEFENRVKLIYIDPPYNTGNDSFKYNDRFNHSTWLTFMKNRLEVARELLSDDGVIFVQCDDNEQAYLKVLMDEVFGRENFVSNFIWHHRKSSQNDIDVSLSHNYTLTFAKNRNNFRLNSLGIDESKFSNPGNDARGDWVADPMDAPHIRENLTYPIINPHTSEEFLPPKGRHWRFTKEKFEQALADNRIIFGKTGKSKPQFKRFKSEAEQKGTNPFTIWSDVGTSTGGTQELMKLMGGKIFSTPKPEALLERILQLATQQGDIILDFFAGSGTTAAVAHKMGRQYIAVEQMDYIETITKARLKKVIGVKTESDLMGDKYNYDTGGISKNVDWQGGGEFIYAELAPLNQTLIDAIHAADNLDTLLKIRTRVLQSHFTQYRLDHEAASDSQAFVSLTLNEQKQILISMLDKNQLYINYSERADALFKCAQEDIKLSEDFYGGEK